MPELLPCPFCNGTFVITTRDKNGKWFVVCNEDDADCNMQISTYPCDTPEEARKQWNTRTPALPPYTTARCVKCPHDSHVRRCVIPVREYDGEDVIEGLCGCEFTAPAAQPVALRRGDKTFTEAEAVEIIRSTINEWESCDLKTKAQWLLEFYDARTCPIATNTAQRRNNDQ